MRFWVVAIVFGAFSFMAAANSVSAHDRGWTRHKSYGASQSRARYYRKGARVRGFVRRRGGYSYAAEDSINTYGDSRGKYGSARSLRDPSIDRQTQGGPFDHGFFFDSGVAPRGGDSPYLH